MKSKNKYNVGNPRKKLHVYIPEKQLEKLKEISEEEQKSVSAIVNELIDKKLDVLLKLDLVFDKEVK